MSLNDCISVADLLPTDPSLTIPNVVFDDAALVQLQEAGYEVAIPALEATWDAATNPYVIGIQFEYTPADGGETIQTAIQSVTTLIWRTTNGIVPERTYSCRWRAVGITAYGLWSTPVDVTILTGWPGLAGADGILTSEEVINFLWSIRPNLWRFDHLVPMNGATVVDPFTDPPEATAFGEQKMAVEIPGGTAAIFLQRSSTVQGLAQRDGASYNISFMASVDSGTATLRARWLDATNNPITGVADQSFTITTTPTTFTWADVHSDDADFENAHFDIFTSSTGDIPSGRTVTITEFMAQNDDYWDVQGMETPWRPSPDEDNILRYAEVLTELYAAQLAANKRATVRTGQEGKGLQYVPPGPTVVIHEAGSSHDLAAAEAGAYIRFSGNCDLNIADVADEPYKAPGVTTVRIVGGISVTLVPATGVQVNPHEGGSLVLSGDGATYQLIFVGKRTYPAGEWDVI